MNESLRTFYEGKAAGLETAIARLKRRSRLFVLAELTTFISAIAALAAYTVYGGMLLPAAAVLLFAAYIVARHMDAANSERIEKLAARHKVYMNELAYLANDFPPSGGGLSRTTPRHPFAYDMDVVGHKSLFQRICRTVTSDGWDLLADKLLSLPGMDDKDDEAGKGFRIYLDGMGKKQKGEEVAEATAYSADEMGENTQKTTNYADSIADINAQRAAIDTLADMEPLRTAFIACGSNGIIDTRGMKRVLDRAKDLKFPRFVHSTATMVVAWLAMAGFFATIALALFTDVGSGVPVVWGTVQLFAVLMLVNRPLRGISNVIGWLNKELKAYGELIDLIVENEALSSMESAKIEGKDSVSNPRILMEIHRSLAEARIAFAELRRILDALDRRGNVLGLIIFDTFLLSDIFLVRRYSRWHDKNIGAIDTWIDRVSEFDALVSMATFRYNHPEAGHAEIVDSINVIYEAKGLWHPFLGERAVRNDFRVDDSYYYIVTGANMAGKSTFLRAVGVNYILAMNGMPVFAESLRVSVYSMFCSMRTNDDLASGISYFNAELRRLRQLIAHCRRHRRTLIILDEILKGTNSLDKLNGSRMFLDAISHLPVTGIIATHDLELSRMEDNGTGRFHNLCFEISLADKITYTYRISHGVARNQNATYLLRNIIADIT